MTKSIVSIFILFSNCQSSLYLFLWTNKMMMMMIIIIIIILHIDLLFLH